MTQDHLLAELDRAETMIAAARRAYEKRDLALTKSTLRIAERRLTVAIGLVRASASWPKP